MSNLFRHNFQNIVLKGGRHSGLLRSYRAVGMFFLVTVLLNLAGCAGEYVEAGFVNPDSPAARAWEDEHSGDDENLGPNSPGYMGPDGEFSMDPDSDPQ